MPRVLGYFGPGSASDAAFHATLTDAGIDTLDLADGAPPDTAAWLIDGTEMDDAAVDAALMRFVPAPVPIMVLFRLSHGVTFRGRRERLLALGAADVIETGAPETELVARIDALMVKHAPPRLLIVEDDPAIADWVATEMAEIGLDPVIAGTLEAAHAAFSGGTFNAMVVDRQLPDGDGLNFIVKLRDLGIGTPALVFTAMDQIEERIRGLEAARADDYICKPAHEDELKARMRVMLRPGQNAETLLFGPLELGRRDRLVLWRGRRIEMRPKETDMLIYLAERAGLPIPQRMIYVDIWEKLFMEPGSNPVSAAKHRMLRSLKTGVADAGEALPEFLRTEGDAYLFDPEELLRLPGSPDANG